jgi:SNF family Na+-dependent transporter
MHPPNMWHSFLFSILKRTIMKRKTRFNFLKKKGYVLVTLTLFLISIALHWIFGWEVFKQEQLEHGQSIIISDYVMEMLRDTMENWQSEFLQLIWQVAGLAFLWYVGSPQSKEGDDRKEEKLDHIIRKIDPENYERLMNEWEDKYPKK